MKVDYSVSALCRSLEVSRSGLWSWNRTAAGKTSRQTELRKLVQAAYDLSGGSYGIRRLWQHLKAKGVPLSRESVADVMRELGLRAKTKRRYRFFTDSNHSLPVADNLLKQEFGVVSADTVWLADITGIPTAEGLLHLACVMDLYSRRIVGWSTAPSPRAPLVVDALEMAIGRRQPGAGVIVHSDRGVQYASQIYQSRLLDKKFVLSMSRKGNCYDNAPMESFFASLKTEVDMEKPFPTRSAARKQLYRYIELWYNTERLHSGLGYKSPATFEQAR